MQRHENWSETYAQLLKAGQEQALEPKVLETLALAAYLTGRDAESFQILERAHQGYLDRKKTEQAVRCAFWIGLMLMNAGEKARGGGWFSSGERLLGGEQRPDCAEQGVLLLPASLGALYAGHAGTALKLSEQAAARPEERRVGNECVSTCRSRG